MGVWSSIGAGVKRTLTRAASSGSQDIDPNFKGSMQFYSPGNPIWTDKDYRSFIRNGYRKNPTVFACINKITGAASGINWKLYTDRTLKTTIDKHDLLDLWRKPNPRMPGSGSFIEQVMGFWHMSGNSYIWAYRPNPGAPPLALWPMRPDRMKAVAGNGVIEDYVYGYETNNPQILSLEDTLHLKFPAYDDDIYGLSFVEVASYLSDQQNETLGWNTALMQNAGRPASVFMSKNYLTVEQRSQIKDELRRKYSGKRNAGMPLVLEADLTWQNMSLTPMEMDFLRSYENNTRGIAAIFDVAPELIGDAAGKTFANVAEARQALYLENVLPKLDRIADFLNSWLVPMYPDLRGSQAFFTYDKEDIEALQALYADQKKSEHDTARADWLAGGITLNEYRDIIGKKKDPNGEIYRIGSILVSVDSLEVYADQSITQPMVAPSAIPEGQPLPDGSQPATIPAPTKKPPLQLPAPGSKQPAAGKKYYDKHGIYQPDDLQKQLQALESKGVEFITWICSKHSCDLCIQNDGITVKLGDSFPSGHILPTAHPNCDCSVKQATIGEKFFMNGVMYASIFTYPANEEIKYDTQPAAPVDASSQESNRSYQGSQPGETAPAVKGQYSIQEITIEADSYRQFINRYL